MTVPTTNLALWLRADSRVASSGARQFYIADKGSLRIDDNAAVSVTTEDFTLAAWVYVDNVSPGADQRIFSKGAGGDTGYRLVILDGGVLDATIHGSASITTTGATLVSGQWYYVLAEFDRDGNCTIYSNDVAGTPTSIAAQSASIEEINEFVLGGYPTGAVTLGGRLSKAAKWDRLLTSAEKTWLYNSGSGRLYGELGVAATDGAALLTSLAAYWNLNENGGTDNAIDAHSTNDLTPTFAELITNGGFETAGGGGADVFANWVESVTGTATITDEGTIVDAGSHSAKLIGSNGANIADMYQGMLVSGRRYTYSFRARNDAGTGGYEVWLGGNSLTAQGSLTTSFQTISGSGTSTAAGRFYLTQGYGSSPGTVYYDTVSVKAVDIPAAAGVGESTGVTDGDPVSRWTSKDAGAYEFAQATASKRPLYKASAINSQPGILFDGVDDLLVCASALLTGTSGSVIVVYRLTAVPNSYQTILASSDEAADTRYMEFIARGNTANPHAMIEQRNADTADTLDGDTTVNVDTDYAVMFWSDGSAVSAMVNAVAQTLTADAGANSGDWWDDATAKDNVSVGGIKRSSESLHMTGYVAEVIVYSAVPSDTDLGTISSYLFSRYGLSIGDYAETEVSVVGWSQEYRQNDTDLVEHTFEWLSDASGNVTLPSGLAVSGQIERVVFIPSSSAAPTSLYDVTLTDEDGVDVLAGQGANLSATVKSSVKPGIPLKDGTTTSTVPTVVDGILTLNVSNAGDSKGGTVVVYVR